MIVEFRASAVADLDAIVAWYDDVSPASTSRILSDIERSIEQLKHFPRSGSPVGRHDLRRIVTLRYHFKISYLILADVIQIVGIFRFQDRTS
jgi:plasmid stabilization system protein ParE